MQVSDVIVNVLCRFGAPVRALLSAPIAPIAPVLEPAPRTHRPFELVETRPPVRVRQLRDGLGDLPEPHAEHDGPRGDAHGGQYLEECVQHGERKSENGREIII